MSNRKQVICFPSEYH